MNIESFKNNWFLNLCSSIFAGLISRSLVHPMDTVRANLQFQQGWSNQNYKGTFDALIQIGKSNWKSLYKGFGIGDKIKHQKNSDFNLFFF